MFPTLANYVRSYHGTSSAEVEIIMRGPINVNCGGGELGRGFYTGEYLHEAKAWAFHKSRDRRANVVQLTTADEHVFSLEIKIMTALEAGSRRHHIRKQGKTRTYIFGSDMIWAPIVGSERASGNQYKWESVKAENMLNDASITAKCII